MDGGSRSPYSPPLRLDKYQVVIPQSVRDQMAVNVGDILEVTVQRGKITLTPKSLVDRAIAEGLGDVRNRRVRGPFNTVDEMLNSLKGKSSVAKERRSRKK